jgi:hypothetical protein
VQFPYLMDLSSSSVDLKKEESEGALDIEK